MVRFLRHTAAITSLPTIALSFLTYLVIYPGTLSAQSTAHDFSPKRTQAQPLNVGANSPGVFVLNASSASDCPISLSAQQRGVGGVITTGSAKTSAISQRIRLILNEPDHASKVASATVTAEGTNGKWRILTASNSQDEPQAQLQSDRQSKADSSNISSTLRINFDAGSDKTESADLDLPGFTSVKSIRLDSVTYADGSIWTPNSGHACRVVPDPLMLIGNR